MMTLNGTCLTQFPNPSFYKLDSFAIQQPETELEFRKLGDVEILEMLS